MSKEPRQIIVTKQTNLATLLFNRGVVRPAAEVLAYVIPDDLMGKEVYGSIPLHLAHYARRVVDTAIILPSDMRNHNLTLEEVEQYARPKFLMYEVRQVGEVDWRAGTTELYR